MLTALHEQRLHAVCSALKGSRARQVLDLGCGSGALTCLLLSDPVFDSVLAMDRSSEALATLRQNLANASDPGKRLNLVHGSWTEVHIACRDYDAAALVETIEHLDPRDLSRMENTVFSAYDLDCIVVTTPNGDYNPLLGLSPGQFRDPDHRFEWPRIKFRKWCRGLANRHGYRVRFSDIGDPDPELGAPTQMAVFTRATS